MWVMLKPGKIDEKKKDWIRILSLVIGVVSLILGIINFFR
jgi:hypothetical protein